MCVLARFEERAPNQMCLFLVKVVLFERLGLTAAPPLFFKFFFITSQR